jgi:hypothetical protein
MFVLLAVVCSQGVNADANDNWEDYPPWLGTWHVNAEVAQLLGFTQEDSVQREKLRIGFFESKDDAIAVAGKELIERVESFFAKRTGGRHQIIAAGRWKDEGELIDSLCSVTQIQGASFLWFGDPSVALMRGTW